MTTVTEKSVAGHESLSLEARLEAMGLAVVWLEDGQPPRLRGRSGWSQKIILESAVFAGAARRIMPALVASHGEAVELFDGLWLLPLASGRRRRAVRDRHSQGMAVVLVVCEKFVQSEHFLRVCDAAGLDATAAASRMRSEGLPRVADAGRLMNVLRWMQEDTVEIDRRCAEIKMLSQQLSESYEELSLLYKLSASMTIDQSPDRFLAEACREFQQVLGLRWMAVRLVDDPNRLHKLSGGVFVEGAIAADDPQTAALARDLVENYGSALQPTIIDDPAAVGLSSAQGIASQLLVVPITHGRGGLGVLFGGDKLSGGPITSIDSKLCHSLANGLAIFLENLALYEDMQGMFLGTLHALTASIDAKDSYTRGHSERVADLARQLALAIGMDARAAERAYLSGLIHDLGKIGVPESVLTKAGGLTTEEFTMIRSHPEIGARILREIRPMSDLVPGVLHHHERWDGRGYPLGLRGDDIPILGRLICLADSFDAMSSDRTYRRAMTHEQVIAEITRCAGLQFDPQLAAVFVTMDFTSYSDHLRRARQASSRSVVSQGETS